MSDVFKCSLDFSDVLYMFLDVVFLLPKEFDDPQVYDSLMVFSNECVDLEFDVPQIFDDQKGTSIGSMDFDNPKVYGYTSIFDGLVSSIYVYGQRRGLFYFPNLSFL